MCFFLVLGSSWSTRPHWCSGTHWRTGKTQKLAFSLIPAVDPSKIPKEICLIFRVQTVVLA